MGGVRSDSPVSERLAPPTTIGGLMPDARDVILKHIAAVNDRDSDAEPWATDAELVAPGGRASGRDGVLAFLGVFHEAFPDLRLEVKQLLTDGPAAAAEGTIVGTHEGVLHTPNGDVGPTGRAVELRWAAVYLTDGDTLKSEHLFFDQMDFLGQLGLLPG
jgi:predicted ester cyclase